MAKNKDGNYTVTEQGDLGLGLNPIDESVIEDEKKKKENSDCENTIITK